MLYHQYGPKWLYNHIWYGIEGPSQALALSWPWHLKSQSQAIRQWLSWAMNFFFVIAKIYRFKNCVSSNFSLSTSLQVSHNVQTDKINCYNTMLLRVFFLVDCVGGGHWTCWTVIIQVVIMLWVLVVLMLVMWWATKCGGNVGGSYGDGGVMEVVVNVIKSLLVI